MPKPLIIILISVAAVFILLVVAASVIIARSLARPKIITIPDEIKYEKEHGMWRDYESFAREEYKLSSYDGYKLNVIYVPTPVPSNKYVIISHGYSGCRLGSVKYLHLFRELGFNAIMYDDRGHGENAKFPCTMGFRESRDLMEVIHHVHERFGEDIYLGLHGESMGCALTNNALQYSPKIDFIVSDCGYNDLDKLMCDLIHRYLHLPSWLGKTAAFASKIMYGYSFGSVKPINYVNHTEVPICFFHGRKDELIPYSHAVEMYNAYKANMEKTGKGYCELHLVDEAAHAMCVITDESAYKEIVKNFLEKISG